MKQLHVKFKVLLFVATGVFVLGPLFFSGALARPKGQGKGGEIKPAATPTPASKKSTLPRKRELPAKASPERRTVTTRNPKAGTIVRNQIGMEFVYIPPGEFMMGSEKDERAKPVHRVTISKGFYMGKYEVTQAQWQALTKMKLTLHRLNVRNRMAQSGVDAENIDYRTKISGEGSTYPMYFVSLDDALEFIRQLNDLNDGYLYRLPSEAEWEYACRAGTRTPFAFGAVLSPERANFSGGQTMPVGSFAPNAFGLYDMHGNVSEWVQDYWHENYEKAPTDGSMWMTGHLDAGPRILRGGDWGSNAASCTCASRDRVMNTAFSNGRGFRLVRIARSR